MTWQEFKVKRRQEEQGPEDEQTKRLEIETMRNFENMAFCSREKRKRKMRIRLTRTRQEGQKMIKREEKTGSTRKQKVEWTRR